MLTLKIHDFGCLVGDVYSGPEMGQLLVDHLALEEDRPPTVLTPMGVGCMRGIQHDVEYSPVRVVASWVLVDIRTDARRGEIGARSVLHKRRAYRAPSLL
jgi:hypothetical protein